MDGFDAPQRFLRAVRRELATVARREALLAVLGVLAISWLAGLALASAAGTAAGKWGWAPIALGLVAVAFCVWRLWVRPSRERKSDPELARWVESRVPGLGSALVTSIEVASSVRSGDAGRLGFSPHLARATADQVAGRLEGVRAAGLPGRGRLRRLAWGAAGVGALSLGAVLLAPGVLAAGAANLVASAPAEAEGESERTVDVALSQLDVEIRPPAYTGLKPRKLERSSGDVEALVGSEVRFAGTALVPATGAALVLASDPKSRWLLEFERDGTVRGVFRVGQDDQYQFALTDLEGRVVRERVWRRVTAKADQAPEVRLLLPETDMEVKPTDQVSFFFEANDDYGIDRVDLVVRSESGEELLRTAAQSPKGGRIAKGDAVVDVAKLGLEAGDSVDVTFEAVDSNAGAGGPGVGKSQARKLTLYSPQDEHDALLSKLEAVIDQMVDVLADRLETPIEVGRVDRATEYIQMHAGIASASEAVVAALGELAAGFATDPMASDDLRMAVAKVAERIGSVAKQESAQLRKYRLDPDLTDVRVLLQILGQTNEEGTTEFERGILELKRLMDGQLKDSVLEAGRKLLETQNEIRELLKKLKDSNDPAAREAALKKLKKLQERLKRLQQEIARLQERAPYENQNAAQRPSEKQQEVADLQSTMEKIQKLIEEGKIDEAMKLLEEMNRSTQEMLAGLEQDLDKMGGRMSAAARKKQMEVKQALDELADGQRGVKDETTGLERELDERAAKARSEEEQAQLQKAGEQAKAVREALKKADSEALAKDDRQALESLEKRAAALEDAIAKGQIGKATKLARDIAKGAGELKKEIGESVKREMNEDRLDELKHGGKQVGDGEKKADALGKMLEGMQPKPGEGMTPGDEGKLGSLGERQKELGERLKGLGQKLDELEKDAPGIKQMLGPKLDEAGKKMGEAKGELDGKQPGSASEKQQEALEKLQEAQQEMAEQMKKNQGQDGQDDTTGVNDPRAKVGIPKEDPYANPRNLRDEILKAMQERAPDKYRDAIRKFYEELTH